MAKIVFILLYLSALDVYVSTCQFDNSILFPGEQGKTSRTDNGKVHVSKCFKFIHYLFSGVPLIKQLILWFLIYLFFLHSEFFSEKNFLLLQI